jgi:biotin synthase
MISELEMAKMVAVSRLVMGAAAKAHCTHESHAASLMAGANLFFPEVGSSPRDSEADTQKGRGHSVQRCHDMQQEMDLDPNQPSNCFC